MNPNPAETPDSGPNLEKIESALAEIAKIELPPQAQTAVQTLSLEVKQLTDSLKQAQAEAQAAKQDKAKFVSVVTHELRLPLTSIKGYTDLLRQEIVGAVNDQQKSFLTIVRTNVDRMSALISDLSDMSYIQTGRLKLQPKPANIAVLVDEFMQPWRERIAEKSQRLNVTLDPALPQVNVDPARFTQVLGTLVSNAHRYTPAEGEIEIRLTAKDGILRVEVQDTGIGISPEDLEHIFTPFFRSEDNAVRESPGWGLALHVAKLMIELMGGQIGVSSQWRAGSLFWFILPL